MADQRRDEPEVTILPPEGSKGGAYRYTPDDGGIIPDMESEPALYDGLLMKRVLAYGVDLVILGLLFAAGWTALSVAAVLTFGLLTPLVALFGLVLAPCYHGFLIGGPKAATLGMRLFGIHVRTLEGRRPSLAQAFIMAIVFYVTVPFTSWLILLFVFFNDRRRTLHDLLSGTVVINRLV